MIKYLLQHEMITGREASLMMQFVVSIFQSESITPKERVRMLKTMLLTLENFS
jgi:transcriptional regulator CtsR